MEFVIRIHQRGMYFGFIDFLNMYIIVNYMSQRQFINEKDPKYTGHKREQAIELTFIDKNLHNITVGNNNEEVNSIS